MTTTNDLIQSTKRWLSSSGRPEMNRLTAQITATATSAQFDFALGQIAPGAILGVDLEEIYVWSTATPNATIQRAWNGSTGAIHVLGSLVEVNPIFSNWRIFGELNNELIALSSPSNGLYRVKTVTKTVGVASTYDVAADATDILAVQANVAGPSGDWPRLRRWDLLANQDTSVYASGVALQLYEVPSPGRTLRITYAAPFTALAALTDDVLAIAGLPTTAHDIPAIGAAARLLASREARRSQMDAQPEARQAADVPPGTARSASAQLFALRDRRIKEEASRLASTYPTVMRPAV